MDSFTLTDLIDMSLLQKIQDSFSRMTGMAVLVTDANGKPITKGAGFTDYCMKYTRQSPLGCERCEQCDKVGAEATFKTGKIATYMCHSGLIDFAAPIVIHGELIGCFIGGQVLNKRPPKAFIRGVARDLGIDFDEYWQALEKVTVMEQDKIDAAAEFLSTNASILSDIAYGKYIAYQATQEVEKAAAMKSDFLANMSHEIRTPMNAVIGMAEMALREELTPEARNYITQIKTSGKALLNIINDILDFSKIDSGRMKINPVEYEPMVLVHDVANVVSQRLIDKDVELLLRIDPSFPKLLLGDDLRVRQVLINLANNAVKFTNQGHVEISLGYEKIDEEHICIRVAVEDTGIGIKKEDLDKLFQSFQQVDSKRNRNIEGTGLGLAISKNLLELMGGQIHVESTYEQGSIFSFELPQRVLDFVPAIQIENSDNLIAIGYFENSWFAKQFFIDMNNLGVYSIALTASESFDEIYETYGDILPGKKIFLFLEENNYDEVIEQVLINNPDITGIMLTEYFSDSKPKLENLRVVMKPFSTLKLALALKNESMYFRDTDDLFEFDFVAPEAQILLVDDNQVNLIVAEGLLKPLNMQITTATSGKQALELLEKQHFDIIFMDHMMPELDGVETTRIIRRLHPELQDIPIIALTANAMDGSKEMFLDEGMNDFVPKPIELKTITAQIKKWLSPEKIQKGEHIVLEKTSAEEASAPLRIGDLDTENAIKMLGSDQLFFSILKEYYKAIPTKSMLIKGHEERKDWKAYTIEVHALKSISRQIGANELADLAEELEKAGNEGDIEKIKSKTNAMLQKYVGYTDILAPFCDEQNTMEAKPVIDNNKLPAFFGRMSEAIDNLDMDKMEQVILDMGEYDYPDDQKELFQQLKDAVECIDVDLCEQIIENWKTIF